MKVTARGCEGSTADGVAHFARQGAAESAHEDDAGTRHPALSCFSAMESTVSTIACPASVPPSSKPRGPTTPPAQSNNAPARSRRQRRPPTFAIIANSIAASAHCIHATDTARYRQVTLQAVPLAPAATFSTEEARSGAAIGRANMIRLAIAGTPRKHYRSMRCNFGFFGAGLPYASLQP